MESSITEKSRNAAKWSLITEIISKIVSPITNMLLARLLTPDAFGMIATITMVISFADLFTDAGFSKYLVQHEFKRVEDEHRAANVSFWTNFLLSLTIWIFIIIFRDHIAVLVGNQGLGNALAIASISIPLTAFISVQTALFRRRLNFKALFVLRLPGILIPLFVTIPLAFIMHSFWAMIIGTLTMNIVNAFLLTIKSTWRPKKQYSIGELKNIFSFSSWTFLEQLLGWANLNVGIFIVGIYLSPYYLGLFKTSMAIVNQLYAIIIASFSPVLLATLSRLHGSGDYDAYKDYYYSFIKSLSIIMLPLGIGVFVFRDFVTLILLGSQWEEAALFIGLWGLVRAVWCVFGIFSTELFISCGKPKYSVLLQIIQLLILIPALWISVQISYDTLVISRTLVIVLIMIIECIFLYKIICISPTHIVKDIHYFIISACLMGIAVLLIRSQVAETRLMDILLISFAVIVYFICVAIPKTSRNDLIDFLAMIKSTVKRKQ